MADTEQWSEKLCGTSPADQVDALRQISGSHSVTGLTVLVVQLAGSRDDDVRMWAAEALETSLCPQEDEVTALTELLSHSDDGEIFYWAATMLGRLGKQAGSAVPALESCIRESLYLPAREQAAWALCQIGPPASAALPTLQAAAQDAPPRLQRIVTQALRVIGEAA